MNQAILGGDENELDRFQGFGHGDGHAIGIYAIGLAVAIKAKRRNDRNNSLREQRLQQFGIDAFDFAGKKMVDALNNAQRMRDDGVGAGGAQIVGGKAFENFVRQPVGRGERELQRSASVMPVPSRSEGLNFLFFGQRFDLRRRAMHEHDADVQRAQHGDIEQNVGEVFVGDDRAIDADDECLFPKARDVLQDAPQVSGFHLGSDQLIQSLT